MNCPNCGKPIPEGKLFCGHCGTKLESVPPIKKSASKPPDRQVPAILPAVSQPAPEAENEVPTQSAGRPRSSSRALPVALWVIGILVIILLLVFIFQPSPQPPVAQVVPPAGYDLTWSEEKNSGEHDYIIIEKLCHNPAKEPSCLDWEKGMMATASFIFTDEGVQSENGYYDREAPDSYKLSEGTFTYHIIFNGDGYLYEVSEGEQTIYNLLFKLKN